MDIAGIMENQMAKKMDTYIGNWGLCSGILGV